MPFLYVTAKILLPAIAIFLQTTTRKKKKIHKNRYKLCVHIQQWLNVVCVCASRANAGQKCVSKQTKNEQNNGIFVWNVFFLARHVIFVICFVFSFRLFRVFFPRQFSYFIAPWHCFVWAKKEKKIATRQKLPVNVCGPAKLPPRTTPKNNWHHHFFSGQNTKLWPFSAFRCAFIAFYYFFCSQMIGCQPQIKSGMNANCVKGRRQKIIQKNGNN